MRGKIKHRRRAQQIRDFSGLRFGNITPTDFDGFVDFGNKAFVFMEAKFADAQLPYGQLLALERACDACQSEDRESYALILRHDEPVDNDIDFAQTEVSEYRIHGAWHKPRGMTTCREFLDWVHARVTS